jgi:hypothetical protein
MTDLTIPGHTDDASNAKHYLVRSILSHKELLEYSCAEVLYLLYKKEFMYQNGWYQYKDKWVRMTDCIELRRKIPLLKGFIDEVNKKFRSDVIDKENTIRDMEDIDDEKEDKDRIKELKSIIEAIEMKRMYLTNSKRQLDKTSFKNNIITECRDLFIGTIDIINEINHDT